MAQGAVGSDDQRQLRRRRPRARPSSATRDDPELQPARLTVDLLRPAALAPRAGRTASRREGRRLNLVEAEMLQHDTVVARARALFLRRGEQPPGEVWTSPIDDAAAARSPPTPSGDAPCCVWAYGRNSESPAPSST